MSAAVQTPLGDAEAAPDADDSLAHADTAAEEAIAAFERAAAAVAAEMRAGIASNDAGNHLDKARVDALGAMGRKLQVATRIERAKVAPPPAVRLRETKPPINIRWNAVADALFHAFPLDTPVAAGSNVLNDHALHVALLIGDDLHPDSKGAECFSRLCRSVGSYVATDLLLDAAERDEAGQPVALILRGQRLPPIAMPAGDDEQRLHTRLLVHEQEALRDHPGIGPVPTLDAQRAARHAAWKGFIDAERQGQRKSAAQVERELIARLPGWARAVGIKV